MCGSPEHQVALQWKQKSIEIWMWHLLLFLRGKFIGKRTLALCIDSYIKQILNKHDIYLFICPV